VGCGGLVYFCLRVLKKDVGMFVTWLFFSGKKIG